VVNKTHFTLTLRPHLPNHNTPDDAQLREVMKTTTTVMASGTTDAPCRTFPFLALPKELRLMVYEALFESITRTHLELMKQPYPWHRGLHPCLAQERNKPVGSACAVHENIPLTILATCRQVYSEAVVVLQPALKALRERPQKLVITTEALRSSFLLNLLKRSAHHIKTIHPYCTASHDEPHPAPESIRIQVAVRNAYANQQLGDLGTAGELWSYLRLHILRLHYENLLFEAETLNCVAARCSARATVVTFHMAAMSCIEKEEFEVCLPFEKSSQNCGSWLQIQGGEEIEVTEWEDNWATSQTDVETVVEAPEECKSEVTDVVIYGSRMDRLICGAYAKWKSLTKRWSRKRRSG
jgi:hypothetical protein